MTNDVLTSKILQLSKAIGSDLNTISINSTPLIKDLSNIRKCNTINMVEGMNKCLGFTYNSKSDEFIMSFTNDSESTKSILKLTSNLDRYGSPVTYSDSSLGKMSTLTYNSKLDKILSTTNSYDNNKITYINPDLSISTTRVTSSPIYNLAYNEELDNYVSIMISNDGPGMIDFDYYDHNLIKIKSDKAEFGYGSEINGSLYYKNQILFSKDYLVNKSATGLDLFEIYGGSNIADFAIKGSDIYIAVNNGSNVDIYCCYHNIRFLDNISNTNILSTKDLDGVGYSKEGKIIYRAEEIDRMFGDILNKLKDVNSKL